MLHISIDTSPHNFASLEYLSKTGADLSAVGGNLFSKIYNSCDKSTNLPHLCATIKEPSQPHETVLLHLFIDGLATRVWFGTTVKLAVGLLPGALFIDHFIRDIVPIE